MNLQRLKIAGDVMLSKMPKIVRFASTVVFISGLAACQATDSTISLETPNAQAAKRIISKGCISVRSAPSLAKPFSTSQIAEDDLKIEFVSRGMDGWWRFGSRTRSEWDESYINTRTGALACGYQNWKEMRVNYVKIKEPFSDSLFVEEIRNAMKLGLYK